MLTPRRYQSAAVDLIRTRERRHQRYRLCMESPTGSGKRLIMTLLLRDPLRQVVLTHRKILLDQARRELETWGIPHGFVAAGYKPNPTALIQLCMTQTLLRRRGRVQIPECDRLHVDELHTQGGPQCRDLFDEFCNRGANLIGYSATPAHLSGIVDEVVRVATVPGLIQQGFLLPPQVFSCGMPDLKRLEKLRRDAMGEYLAGDVDKLVKPQIIFGSVMQHYKRLSNGSPFFLFAHSVKASLWWAQMLSAKGIPTAHIDTDDVWVDGKLYKSDSVVRQACFDRLTSGDLAGISNRFVLREGVDCPAVGHIILTAPVGSRVSFVQQCGRGLRPHEGQEHAIIQDHSGSCLSHPSLDSVEPWDWRAAPGFSEKVHISKMRNDILPEPIICPKCHGQRMTGDTCPYCGFRYARHCRFVQQIDGALRLVEGKTFRRQKITRRPNDQETWDRLYWGAVKHKPNRTFEQIRAYYAYKNQWRWLPRDLKRMPRTEAGWFSAVGRIPTADLITDAVGVF